MFLEKENISATNLADNIGVQRSSISHILSGRNNPSFDFIYKFLNKYEYINAEWLITGKGNMYKQEQKVTNNIQEKEQNLFKEDSSYAETSAEKKSHEPVNIKFQENDVRNNEERKVTNVNKIEKIVYFYKNGTFREYNPSE